MMENERIRQKVQSLSVSQPTDLLFLSC